MSSFQKLSESLGQDLWGDSKPKFDERAVEELIKRGFEIRPDRSDGKNFWDDFLLLLGQNQSGAAELFGVRPDVISRATTRARKAMKKVREENDYSDKREKRERRNMLHTGVTD